MPNNDDDDDELMTVRLTAAVLGFVQLGTQHDVAVFLAVCQSHWCLSNQKLTNDYILPLFSD